MNRRIVREAGFDAELALIDSGKCPWCKSPVTQADFKGPFSLKEFEISGLCQACQDGFLNEKLKPKFKTNDKEY